MAARGNPGGARGGPFRGRRGNAARSGQAGGCRNSSGTFRPVARARAARAPRRPRRDRRAGSRGERWTLLARPEPCAKTGSPGTSVRAASGAQATEEWRLGRLRIFAKGNIDVRDSLHSMRIGGKSAGTASTPSCASGFPPRRADQARAWTRIDALLGATGAVPAELAAWWPPLGAILLAAQSARRSSTPAPMRSCSRSSPTSRTSSCGTTATATSSIRTT